MLAAFQRLAAQSRQVVERVHGSEITVYPVSTDDVNAGPAVSSDLPSWETVGCFFQNTMMDSEARSHPSGDGRRVMHRAPPREVSIRLVEGQSFKTGYHLRRHEDNAWFQISSFDPDGVGTVLALVTPAAALEI
jgi:hypothetical protein